MSRQGTPAVRAEVIEVAGTVPLEAGCDGTPVQDAPVVRRPVSERTAQRYGSDWAAFRAWCRNRGAPPLPAAPAVVATYLAERSATLGQSGLRLILAAVSHHHRRAGQPWAPGDPAIAAALRRIGRKRKRTVRAAAALTSAEMCSLLADTGDDLAGVRDRALLLLGFGAALRRSELVALDHEDVRFTPTGLVLRIRSRKASRDGHGAEVALARASQAELCPVRATEAWLRRASIEYGPVFRRLTAAGTVEGRLTGNGVWKVLRRRAEAAGLVTGPGERLSPHALRAGALAEAVARKTAEASKPPARKKAGVPRVLRRRAGTRIGKAVGLPAP